MGQILPGSLAGIFPARRQVETTRMGKNPARRSCRQKKRCFPQNFFIRFFPPRIYMKFPPSLFFCINKALVASLSREAPISFLPRHVTWTGCSTVTVHIWSYLLAREATPSSTWCWTEWKWFCLTWPVNILTKLNRRNACLHSVSQIRKWFFMNQTGLYL